MFLASKVQFYILLLAPIFKAVNWAKELTMVTIVPSVRAKTVVTFLEFAVMYAADSLKATCIDYLCHNIEMALDQRYELSSCNIFDAVIHALSYEYR